MAAGSGGRQMGAKGISTLASVFSMKGQKVGKFAGRKMGRYGAEEQMRTRFMKNEKEESKGWKSRVDRLNEVQGHSFCMGSSFSLLGIDKAQHR